jgi:hypothetical protein
MSPSLNDGAKGASMEIPMTTRKAFYLALALDFLQSI